jgi:hypothetical protein
MKRRITVVVLALAFCVGALAAYRLLANNEAPLARYTPSGALLYLETKNFSGLLADWRGSREKAEWVDSANYEVFSRSRLFERLKQARDEFTSAAGLPPDMNFVSQVAGSESSLALYDIGKLQFLYITKLDLSKAEQTALLESRAKFETRSAAGVTFYYRQDVQSGREVAFAASSGYLLLATREDLMASALQLLAGGRGPSVEEEPWWARSVAAAPTKGDLRMVLNLGKIVPSPYFRSYWIQQNVTDMKAYSAAVSDLYLSRAEYREQRVLLKKSLASTPSASESGMQAVAELRRLVPASAGTYQIRSSPSADACATLLETKLLAPHSGAGIASKIAPQVELSDGEEGGSGDMETRIDQRPPEMSKEAAPPDLLKAFFAANPVEASLSLQRTSVGPEQVFVRFHSAIVLLGSSEWNEASALSAMANFTSPMLTASSLGLKWRSRSGVEELDGLWGLSAALRGKYLFISGDPELLGELLSGLERKVTAPPATFLAGFNHTGERMQFEALTRLLDDQNVVWNRNGAGAPSFLADNLGSLGSVLSGVSSQEIVARDSGDKVLETVTYEWAN